MKSRSKSNSLPIGPSQRQLRAGELVRHAVVDIFREHEFFDEALVGVSVTISEVRLSPDLKHATVFLEPLGAGLEAGTMPKDRIKAVIKAYNEHSKYLRGQLGKRIDMKFTPDLRFMHDESFAKAAFMDRLFDMPEVKRDLQKRPDNQSGDNQDDQ